MNISVNSVESYDALSEEEQIAVVGSFVTAYVDSNIDGYGDEGAGYDGDEGVRNLIAAGWSLNTPVQGAPDAADLQYPYEEGSFFYYTGCGVCQVNTEKEPCKQHQPQAYIKVLEARIESLLFSL